MDKSRKQFEETIKKLSNPSEFESKLKRANNELNYAYRDVDLMWISWQASRESLINNLEPVCFGIINEEDGKLFLDRAKNKRERAIYHRDILAKYSLGKKLTITPLYRLDK